MAHIEPKYGTNGEIKYYKLVVSVGRNWEGKHIRHKSKWIPPRKGMSQKQMEREATAAAAIFEKNIQAGYQIDNNKRFCDYAEYVIDLKKRGGLSPSTIERYRSLLPRINDYIGHMKLTDIRPWHLNEMYRQLGLHDCRNIGAKAVAKPELIECIKALCMPKCWICKETGLSQTTLNAMLNGDKVKYENAKLLADYLDEKPSDLFKVIEWKKSLSNKTVLEHHRLVSMILATADKEMLVQYNAAAKATPPKAPKPKVDYFQPEEMRKIIKALETVPLKWKVMCYILIDTGCRRGELMGLQWKLLDLEKGIMMIEQALLYTKEEGIYLGPPKTGRPRAVLLAPETISVLKEYYIEQERIRLDKNDNWNNDGFLFLKDDGTPMHPDSITKWLSEFSEENHLRHIHPHAFRHTAASILISNGIDVVTTAAELGHATATTTMNIYAHQIARARAEAAGVRGVVFNSFRQL